MRCRCDRAAEQLDDADEHRHEVSRTAARAQGRRALADWRCCQSGLARSASGQPKSGSTIHG
jgi:hypothetical protein